VTPRTVLILCERAPVKVNPVPNATRGVGDDVTAKMHVALSYLERAREDDPNTDDGVLTNVSTFYDAEVAVAFVHWRTARALVTAGLARYGDLA
jgi:hypothetical protein